MSDDFPPPAKNGETRCGGEGAARKELRKRFPKCTSLQENPDPKTLGTPLPSRCSPPSPHHKPSQLPNSAYPPPRSPQAAQRSPLSETEGSRPKEKGGTEGGQAPGGWKESPDFPALNSTRVGRGLGVFSERQVLLKSGNHENRFPGELQTGGFCPPKDPSPRLGTPENSRTLHSLECPLRKLN